MAKNWQTTTVPLGVAGLSQRSDPRASPAVNLEIAKDLQFSEVGGVQPRCQYDTLDTAISDMRLAYANGNELLAFTKSDVKVFDGTEFIGRALSSTSAVSSSESVVAVTPYDQLLPDRAELNGYVWYVWQQSVAGTFAVYLSVYSKTTGSCVFGPESVLAGSLRPRVIALGTKMLLTLIDTGTNELQGWLADPAEPEADVMQENPVVLATAANLMYDLERIPGADAAAGVVRLTPTTSYTVFKITSGGTLTTSTKARTCTDAIALAISTDGVNIQVLRSNVNALLGDRITLSSLADAATAQALGSLAALVVFDNITAVYTSSTSCTFFVTYEENDSPGSTFETRRGSVTTSGSIAQFPNAVGNSSSSRRLALASRAFTFDGEPYVWMRFVQQDGFTSSTAGSSGTLSQLQNTYFLIRSAFVIGKASFGTASPPGAASINDYPGWLPGVALINSTTDFAWAASKSAVFNFGGVLDRGFAARDPLDITFELDSNVARKPVKFGKSLYFAGSQITVYDGAKFRECGFSIFPYYLEITANGGVGDLSTGDYATKISWKYINNNGESERSTTVTVPTITITNPDGISYAATSTIPALSGSEIVAEVWRTQVDPTADSPFHLTTSLDPADSSNPNRFLFNDTNVSLPTFVDTLADEDIAIRETHPENGSELENFAPPGARIIAANSSRLFLARVNGDPEFLWYSKNRIEGRVASFNDGLKVEIPNTGDCGVITAVSFLNDAVIVFREKAVYVLTGDGFDNVGAGVNYFVRQISSEVGAVSVDAVGLSDRGIYFLSSKGWYLLDRGWQLTYIGADVSDYDGETFVGVDVLDSAHQVRCVSTERQLVFDTVIGKWSEWTLDGGLVPTGTGVYDGAHFFTHSTGIRKQASVADTPGFALELETGWIKLADIQGASRIRWCELLGEWLSDHSLRIRVAYNYDDSSYIDDALITPSSAGVGQSLQVKFGLSRPQCEAFKVRINITEEDNQDGFPTGLGAKLTALSIEYGVTRGLYRRLPAASKT